MASDDIKEFTIKVKMQTRWIPHFLGMLKKMQYLGSIGSSRNVTLFADGDGDFRPKFEWDVEATPVEGHTTREGDSFFDAG